jgi:hypothetical protein
MLRGVSGHTSNGNATMHEDLSNYHQPITDLFALPQTAEQWAGYRLNDAQVEFYKANGYVGCCLIPSAFEAVTTPVTRKAHAMTRYPLEHRLRIKIQSMLTRLGVHVSSTHRRIKRLHQLSRSRALAQIKWFPRQATIRRPRAILFDNRTSD